MRSRSRCSATPCGPTAASTRPTPRTAGRSTRAESTRARFGLARSLASHSRLEEALARPRRPPRSHRRIPRFTRSSASFTSGSIARGGRGRASRRYVALLPPRKSTRGQHDGRLVPEQGPAAEGFKGRVPQEIEGDANRVYRVPFKLVDKKIVLQGRVNRTSGGVRARHRIAERTGVVGHHRAPGGHRHDHVDADRGRRHSGAAAPRHGARRRARESAGCASATCRSRSAEPCATRCRGGSARACRRSRSACRSAIDYQRREVHAGADPAPERGGLRPADAGEPSAARARAAQFHASGVLRRRHGRRADLHQRRNGRRARR